MDLLALGWTADRVAQLPPGCEPGRVLRVDRGRLTVRAADGERRVHPAAGLHGAAAPAVGDWVALRGELAVGFLPRRSAFTRTAAGRTSAAQVVAANVDVVLVVDALIGEARVRRIERYLAVAWSSGAAPAVVLTKADLCDDVTAAVEQVTEDAIGVPVLPVSSVTAEGLDAVRELFGPGRTAAMVGPSGVGKSSLANALAGRPVAGTRGIREDGRGRHTTTARELHLLPGGGLLVDTPGMRELGLHDDADGVAQAYADVEGFAAECRYRDCEHRTEPGCAVAAAIDDGLLDPARITAWRKLQGEARHQLLRVDARARAEERKRLRALHRTMRERPYRTR
ncbi:ribosome small subunit-dependent GTPase A [Blastococcus sp. TBT05-19]|uniref:ribosome small subunit-dependent GTPase A n=1 Tax=Blastococcus sp. TBT05-19 TaxID=2250581 RepID=UPI000DE9A3BB|nr:ribosome small subunit-dependent GTPase A [Blastococcus sp. TBT05-19]RBY92032.1 ribosome small subunit-dependent GTPase A [Blastococcus sp. TBT05-19]